MKTIQLRMLCRLLIVGAPFLFLAACGDGGGGGSSVTAGTGTVSVSLTDNQNGYNAVVLTIKEVGIVASNTKTTYYNDKDLGNLPLTVNILDFPNEATLHLGDIEVDLPANGAPVCFKQIRLVLAAEGDPECPAGPFCNYVVETGDPTQYELKTPSGQQSGVKIKTFEVETPNDFCVDADDDAVQVSIDFDPATAINKNKSQYILKPTSIRIIEGNWFTAPDSFIDGLVAVPTYNSTAGCEAYPTTPLVTIAAYYNSATMTDPPVVQTVALSEGPVSGTEVCGDWCNGESDPGACVSDCEAGLSSECYYGGKFKLLLPEKDTYYLTATWERFSDEVLDVEYNSTVFFELLEE